MTPNRKTILNELDYPSTPFQPKLNTMNTLRDQDIHVWYTDVRRFKNQVEAESLLSSNETERYGKFLDSESKAEFLLGRYLVRTKLSFYENKILPTEWEFKLSERGKPSILNSAGQGLYFSLSHSGGKVACAFARNPQVGIDIESNLKEKSFLVLAERIFSKLEFESLKKAPEENQAVMFFKYWSLKEAYSKATGLGLQSSFDSFSFLIDNEKEIQIRFSKTEEQNSWKFFLLSSIANFQTALAVHSSESVDVKEFFLSP